MFDACTTGDTAHIDTILKFLPHTRQHGCFLLAQTPSFNRLFTLRTNGPICGRFPCVLCTKCTLHNNHRLTRVIFQHTKRLLPRSGHFLTTYTRTTERQKCELRRKTSYWEKNFLSCSFYLYRFRKYVSYVFPIINFCNPGPHYETS